MEQQLNWHKWTNQSLVSLTPRQSLIAVSKASSLVELTIQHWFRDASCIFPRMSIVLPLVELHQLDVISFLLGIMETQINNLKRFDPTKLTFPIPRDRRDPMTSTSWHRSPDHLMARALKMCFLFWTPEVTCSLWKNIEWIPYNLYNFF